MCNSVLPQPNACARTRHGDGLTGTHHDACSAAAAQHCRECARQWDASRVEIKTQRHSLHARAKSCGWKGACRKAHHGKEVEGNEMCVGAVTLWRWRTQRTCQTRCGIISNKYTMHVFAYACWSQTVRGREGMVLIWRHVDARASAKRMERYNMRCIW